ncbi:glycosyltransferase family 28 C-terminal domain-containing protein [Trichophaea hybrida]|nr:glycosyltransferase family 28 C-terminal domain-containing protein [Trichophaea hybrida]
MSQLSMPPAPPGFYNPPGTNIFIPDPSYTAVFTPPHYSRNPQTCLITVGATAPFRTLVFAALSPSFLTSLSTHNFRRLIIQAGTTFSDPEFQSLLSSVTTSRPGLEIEAFDFHPDLAATYIAKAEVVISHAGAGSILDALRWGRKLVVVENRELMGGHQREGLVEDLGKAVGQVMSVEMQGKKKEGGVGVVGVLEEEMGLWKEG